MIAQVNGDPWMEAWRKLEAFIVTGATKEQITEYARELGRGLPDARDPVAYAHQAEAVQQVVREILS
ncbi:MAG: hypothetical protein ACREX8_16490 [Gammaproteobacteria bacterium]